MPTEPLRMHPPSDEWSGSDQRDHPRLIRRLDHNPDITQVLKPRNFKLRAHIQMLSYQPATMLGADER